MYNIEEYNQYRYAPHLKIRDKFDLFLIGLDTVNFTVKELYQELYTKLNSYVGKIDPSNIMVIDKDSVLCKHFF